MKARNSLESGLKNTNRRSDTNLNEVTHTPLPQYSKPLACVGGFFCVLRQLTRRAGVGFAESKAIHQRIYPRKFFDEQGC